MNEHAMTTTDDVLSVLPEGDRISYPTLLDRLRAVGKEPRGMLMALDDPSIIRRWRTGKPYSWLDAYDEKNRGPMYVERA